MDISLFNSLPEKGKAHISSSKISILDFLKSVKSGHYKEQIEKIRTEQDKTKRDILKKQLPAVTISGIFTERKQELLITHSGFIQIDIDHFSDKSALITDQYTYSLFKSASGGGLAIVVKVNPDKHKESFNFLRNYYFKEFGIVVDSAPQNVASLRFVSYDPELIINERSKLARTLTEKKFVSKSLPIVIDGDTVAQMVAECVNLGHNLAPDYDSYLKLGFAIASGFDEKGREYFHSLCSVSEKYDSRHAEKQYTSCLKGNKNGITAGTFYWMLKQVGIHAPENQKKAVQVATLGKRSGHTPDVIKKQLTEINGINASEANKLVDEVFKRDDISIKSTSADPEQLIQALTEWMTQNHAMKVNAITRIIEENGIEVRRERINSIYLRARMFFNTNNITKDLVESYIFSDFIKEYNPISEYINKNLHRKSIGNISDLSKCIRSNTEMKEIFIRKWVISLIAAYNGSPVRSVLSLVGGQNSGKTEWFRRLLPNDLKKYYAESKLDAGKDDDILMCQKLIVMDDEMGGKSKQDEKRFKELTSKSIFSLRAPYARSNEDFKRLAVLCGTSNDPEIINDPTGNTRILPIEVLSIDHELYNSIDKDELFMEAYRAFSNGDEWQLNKDELALLDGVGQDFQSIAYERELIYKFFKSADNGGYSEWLTATEIKDFVESNTKQKIHSMRKFGMELAKVFGKSRSKSVNGVILNRYEVIRVNGQSSDNQDVGF